MTNTLTSLTFDSKYFDSVNVGLIDYDPFKLPNQPMAGKYSLLIEPQFWNATISLSQRADIPANATELQVDEVQEWITGTEVPRVSINGIPLAIGTAWDVSRFAGQNVELRLDVTGNWSVRLDAFRFRLRAAFSGITRNSDATITIAWTGGGTLQSATGVNGPWQDVSGATGYTLQISRNNAFTSLIGTYNVTSSACTPTTALPTGTYYWRVQARGSNGPSGWSATWKLIISK